MTRQEQVIMPSISFIVARSYPGNVIGCENTLPWRLKTDLQNFKKLTTGHVVIMGRKTLDSIGKPLPERMNVVLSRDLSHKDKGIFWARDLDNALFIADILSICYYKDEFFVIGGEQIYKNFLFKDFVNKIYLTEVYCEVNGDAYFDFNIDQGTWKKIHEQDFECSDVDDFPFRFSILKKKNLTVRRRLKSELLTDFVGSEELRQKMLQRLESLASKLERNL